MSDDPEFEAIRLMSSALAGLDDQLARGRVLRYVAERYGVVLAPSSRTSTARNGEVAAESADEEPSEGVGERSERGGRVEKFTEMADLYDAASPKTSTDKALVVAYWHQIGLGHQDFGAYEVNTSLKHLGHGVANITSALTSLMERKPVLVMQIRKAGKSAQARKRYKVTREGVRAVEKMIEARAAA